MFPGMNPRKTQQMMRKMGIQQVEVPADEVVIRSGSKEIVITEPSVSKVNMMGQETFQIVGTVQERSISSTPAINDDDIKTVMEQCNCSMDEAKAMIEKHKGDLAEAILEFQDE